MTTKKRVDEFLQQKTWAFVGVSNNKKKFGSFAYQELKSKGIQLIAVNPNIKTVGADSVYPSLSDLPSKVDAVLIAVSPGKTAELVKEAFEQGIKHIWLQQGAESPEAIQYCRDNDINCIYGECILMFAEPLRFPHSVHRLIWKVIGRLPK